MGYPTLTEDEWTVVERIYVQLDEDQLEEARAALDKLLRARPDQPDLRMVDAAVSLEEGDPARALAALKGAERSADPAAFFHLRAVCEYELCRFEAARDDAQRALDVLPDYPEAHDLLARTYAHLGDTSRAEEHIEAAETLDPEAYPRPLDVDDDEFDALVEKSLAELPERVRRELERLPVIVDELPSRQLLTLEEPPLSPDILGLFVGPHLFEHGHDELPSAPGSIHLFRGNLRRTCHDRDELAREVRITVQHEVGHLLGLDEDDLEEWGLG
ncbi:MAG TPA: metallopeptidase family protein [Dongiaceae bacterium]|nr:metallopeptidase family protein [Dongiaceae bacterium]